MDEEGAKITELDPILGSEVSGSDLLPIVDVSDTSMASTGTDKKLTIEELGKAPQTLTNKTLSSPLFTGTIDGWISAGETWTYVSTDDPTGVIKINANVTSKYSEGMRLKMTNGGNTIYAIITKMGTYGGDEAGYTYITFLHEIDPTDSKALHLMANSAITSPYYSTQKVPRGFPLSPAKWRIYKLITSAYTQNSPTSNTWYNVGGSSTQINLPIGSWDVYYKACVVSVASAIRTLTYASTLSTAGNTNALPEFQCTAYNQKVDVFMADTFFASGNITITSKATYYLNLRAICDIAITSLTLDATNTPAVISATCAYL